MYHQGSFEMDRYAELVSGGGCALSYHDAPWFSDTTF